MNRYVPNTDEVAEAAAKLLREDRGRTLSLRRTRQALEATFVVKLSDEVHVTLHIVELICT